MSSICFLHERQSAEAAAPLSCSLLRLPVLHPLSPFWGLTPRVFVRFSRGFRFSIHSLGPSTARRVPHQDITLRVAWARPSCHSRFRSIKKQRERPLRCIDRGFLPLQHDDRPSICSCNRGVPLVWRLSLRSGGPPSCRSTSSRLPMGGLGGPRCTCKPRPG